MCRDCREQNLQRKREQSGAFVEPRVKPIKKGGYESKSKKVWRDRYEAARMYLKLCVSRYVEGIRRGYYLPGNDSWIYGKVKRNDWVASKSEGSSRRQGARSYLKKSKRPPGSEGATSQYLIP